MKKYLPSLLILFSGGVIALGCNSALYAQGDYGNYDNGYDNGDNNGYGNNNDNSYDYNNDNYDQDGNGGGGGQISFNDFYSQLAPYGRWVSDPNYGRVWIANVPNFQPYSSNGYWTYTNYGWTWVSNYDWGWAPFHYGRWGFSNMNGWFWVPGYQWGPAWVGWSSSSDMYGWAPLSPGTSIGVSFAIGSVPINFWTFMPRRYLGYRNIHNYYIPRSRYGNIVRHSNIISNYRNSRNERYALGPQPRDVSRSTGRAVRTSRIVNSRDSRGTGLKNNELHMYRPAVRGGASSTRSNGNRSNGAVNRDRGNAPTRGSVNPRGTTNPSRSQTQRSSTEAQQRSGQQRAAEQRATRQRATDQRASQERATQQRATDQRASQQRDAQQRESQQRAAQQRESQQRATQQRAAQQRESQQRATQQRAAQQRESQQRAAQQRANQQRESQQRATQQRAERATQRAEQQQTQRAERTQQRVERVEQRSSTRGGGSTGRSNSRGR